MSAQLRDYYLSTLGVVQYVPSEFCVAHSDDPVAVAAPAVEQPVKVKSRPAIDLDNLTPAQPQAATASVVPVEIEAKVPVEPEQAAPEVRFRISYWQIEDLLVLSSLDYGENPPQDQHQLLGNILKAVNRLPGPLSEPELMDWPPVPSTPADAAGARAMFSAFLAARVEQSNIRWVLVMGERASDYLLSKAPAPDNGVIRLSEQCSAISTPGLAEMLLQPECKRTTWQAIRHLSDCTP